MPSEVDDYLWDKLTHQTGISMAYSVCPVFDSASHPRYGALATERRTCTDQQTLYVHPSQMSYWRRELGHEVLTAPIVPSTFAAIGTSIFEFVDNIFSSA